MRHIGTGKLFLQIWLLDLVLNLQVFIRFLKLQRQIGNKRATWERPLKNSGDYY